MDRVESTQPDKPYQRVGNHTTEENGGHKWTGHNMDLAVTILIISVVIGITIPVARGLRNWTYHQATGREHPLRTQRRHDRAEARNRHQKNKILKDWEQAKRRRANAGPGNGLSRGS